MHIQSKAKPTFEPIAIIGVACRFPGAPNLVAFAELLARGGDAVTEIPAERWTRESYLHTDPRQPGKAYTLAAGVVENVDRFDAAFFGISPREAVQMDPQQRLLLELAHEALEDAGLPGRRLAGTRTGVYIGGSSSDYLALRIGDPACADAYFMTGATLSTLSNRVSYVFDLKGPSFTVDTACSSSLVALHLACSAMRRGEVDVAMVGGVNLMLSPYAFVGFSRANMLSPRGRCHAFGAGADGYVRAEGGGMVLLKPLTAALADGDPIRAVIEGTGVNSDGRTAGLSLPSGAAQAALLREVYGASRIDPNELVYVEAHGTGTAVGDPIEARALGEVLGQSRSRPLPIGSVKTNIGHLESGSGMAGLLKAVLVLRDGTIPASLHSETLNPAIDFEELNLVVARQAMAVEPQGPRRAAAVNSFGFGGTNAHAVLSAAPEAAAAGTGARQGDLPPLLISARSGEALNDLAAAWRDRLDGLDPAAAALLLRGAARGREHHARRLVATGADSAEIVAALEAQLAGRESPDLATGTALGGGGVAFVYSGNGSQWAGMAADGMLDPAFRRAIEEVDAELAPLLGWSVQERLASADAATMRRTDVAQPLLFAVQYATTVALGAAGVSPSAHLGHSVGEVAAALAAGALSLADAAQVIAVRSAAQELTAHQGGMAVLALGPDEAQALLEMVPELMHDVAIAAVNSRSSITVAGPAAALERLERLATRRRVHFAGLDLDYSFHSAAMDPIREGLLRDLEGIRPGRALDPFYSTVYGRAHDGTGLGPEYWWQNVRAPVRFADAVAAAVSDGCRILLEIGPTPVLQSYLRDGLRQADAAGRVMHTLSRRAAGGAPFHRIAGQVHAAGHDISGAALFDGPAALDELPRYPWQRERYWYERTDEATDTVAARQDHPLLGYRRGDEPNLWFNTLDTGSQPWLADHAVDGAALLPATAMVEMALAAARARFPEAAALDVLDLEITRPLLLERDTGRETRFSVTGERGTFELASRARLSGEPWTVHATGRVAAGSLAPLPTLSEGWGSEDWGTEDRGSGDAERSLGAAALYALTLRLGLQYGPAFQTVARVEVQGRRRGLVHLVPDASARTGYLMDPARLDGALQGLVALAAEQVAGGGAALLPWRVGRVRLARPAGAGVAVARLRVNQVGPRSISADVALLDEAGAVVTLLGDCWFTRVGAGAHDELAESSFYTASVPRQRAEAVTAIVLPVVAGMADAGEDEAALLSEAYIAAAAVAALAGITVGLGAFSVAGLVAEGRVHPESRWLLGAILAWLERDELATCEGGQWSLSGSRDLPPAAEIWRSILAGAPTAVAEAALVGAMGEVLPEILAEGRAALPRGLAALTAHMQTASPTAIMAVEAVARAVGEVAGAWPANRSLRVLELGASDGSVTRRFVDVLIQSGAAVEYVAAVGGQEDQQSIAAAVERLPGAAVVGWELGQDLSTALAASRFDLVCGVLALTRGRGDTDGIGMLQAMLAPGGVLVVAEPRPNRVWDLRFGLDAGWGRAEASALLDGWEWLRVLQAAGFGEATAVSVGAAVWSASVLVARAHGTAAPGPARTGVAAGLLIVAGADDMLGLAVADAMLAEGRKSLAVPFEGAAEMLRSAPPRDGDIVFVVSSAGAEEAWLEGVAQAGAALGAWAAALADTTGLRLWVVSTGAAEACAALRGITRVLANEAPNLRPYFLALEPGLSPDAAAALVAAEIGAPDAETEMTLGTGTRFTPRVRRGLRAAAPLRERVPARLVVGRPGLLDTLRWEAMPARAPGPNEVGIAVAAAGLNFRDVMWALGLLPDEALLGGLAGATLGLECAGVVTAIGPGVDSVAVGDRVMAIAPASLSTDVVAPAQSVVKLPAGVDFAAAATVPVAFLTVCYSLGTLANLQAGERVLIHGGAGGVGLAAIQYARHRGAEVFASAGSPAKRAMLRLLGVEHVLDSRSLAFADDVMATTGGQGVDVVLNSLSGEAMERSVGVLRPFGRFLELGKRDLYGNTPLGLRALRHNVSYFAIDADQLPVQRPDVARRVFGEIVSLMELGVLRPLPHRLFRFGGATDAFRLMQSAGHIGKIVLVPEPEGVAVVATPPRWSPSAEGTYIVTGGLAGFGLETARWLVDQGVRSLALLGRRGAATPGAAEAMAGFLAQGVLTRALAVDVADEAALSAALAEVRATMLPIRGVVHAAMVLDDGLMPQLDAARFRRVLWPKLAGGMALDRLIRQDPIDTFLLFSSITTTLGNPGQANYVAANAGLEAIAVRRQAEGLPGMSVGWGPIADVGYLSREAAVSEALAARMGGAHMQSRTALDLLPVLLGSGAAYADLSRVRWGPMRAHLPHLATPQFAEVMRGQATEGGTVDLAKLLAESTPEEARALVGEILTEEVAAITKAPNHQIDLSRSLTDLGMDSLMAVELRMSLERRFGANLPLLSLADGSSIGSIAVRIVRHLTGGAVVLDGAADATRALIAKYEDDAPGLEDEPADADVSLDVSLEGTAGDD